MSLRVNEIFYSLQGEGMRAGTPNVFVRFSGCNMRCRMEAAEDSPGGFDCDTEFVSGVSMDVGSLLSKCKELTHGLKVGVIFTGGEPGLQLTKEIVDAFREAGWGPLCIETNGSIDVSHLGLSWITVSPKVAEHAVKQVVADEVKYVRNVGQGIPKPACKAEHRLLSPAMAPDGLPEPGALEHCIRLVKECPEWRLSVQQHKSWRVR